MVAVHGVAVHEVLNTTETSPKKSPSCRFASTSSPLSDMTFTDPFIIRKTPFAESPEIVEKKIWMRILVPMFHCPEETKN